MSAKFTPGPWSCQLVNVQHSISCKSGAIAYTRCLVDDIQDAANASLIAAAPDMYEALRELVDDVCDRVDLDSPSCNPGIKTAVKFARAALAKAVRGELGPSNYATGGAK